MNDKKPLLSVDDALAAILANSRVRSASKRFRSPRRSGARWRAISRPCAPSRQNRCPPWTATPCAGGDSGGPLKVLGESSAGAGFSGVCGPGEAVRIFTGAPMPEGADSVLIQEDAARDGDFVTARITVARGRNVRGVGVDFREGDLILRAGRRLSPADVALAAAADHPALPVARKPRVAVLSTGDELVLPGRQRGPDQIVASNAFAVLGLIEAAGGEALDLGLAPDQPDAIEAAIRAALAGNADVLVTVGGASVGDRDFVRGALAAEGMALEFWKIALKPGKPLIHGAIGPTRVLGLPGNPVSALVCGELFLKPLLRALCGDFSGATHKLEPAVAGADCRANGPRREFLRATLACGEDGGLIATPQKDQDSSLTGVLARSDALILREENAPALARGGAVRVLRLTS